MLGTICQQGRAARTIPDVAKPEGPSHTLWITCSLEQAASSQMGMAFDWPESDPEGEGCSQALDSAEMNSTSFFFTVCMVFSFEYLFNMFPFSSILFLLVHYLFFLSNLIFYSFLVLLHFFFFLPFLTFSLNFIFFPFFALFL